MILNVHPPDSGSGVLADSIPVPSIVTVEHTAASVIEMTDDDSIRKNDHRKNDEPPDQTTRSIVETISMVSVSRGLRWTSIQDRR
jgi:hypothetical protein